MQQINLMLLRVMVMASGLLIPSVARADAVGDMVSAICQLVKPLVGKSQMVSLIFVIALAATLFLWWMNENKEGVIIWVLRTGVFLGVIINIFTLPELVGLPPTCSSTSGTIPSATS